MQNRFKSGRSSDNDDEDESIVFTPKNDQDEKPGQDDNNQLSIQQQLKEAVDAQIADLDNPNDHLDQPQIRPQPDETRSEERHSIDQLLNHDQEYLDVNIDQTAKKPLKTPDPTPGTTRGATPTPKPTKVARKKDPMLDSVDRRDRKHSVVTGPRSKDPDNRKLDKAMLENIRKNSAVDERDAFNSLSRKAARRLMETEEIIRGTLELLDTDPWDDLGNWQPDAERYKGMRLSHSKMIKAIDHREPRTSAYDGRFEEFPLYNTDIGYHSENRANRKSDIEELGEATNLYFKFMKYFMLWFFIATLFSGPAIALFIYGVQYDDIQDWYTQFTGMATLGNLGPYVDMTCASAFLPPSRNKASYIGFACKNGKNITGLEHFGLAYQNQTCTGKGFKKSVRTIDRCSMGTMEWNDPKQANYIQETFQKSCVGKKVCSMFIDYEKVFTPICQREIENRQKGNVFYGPSKVYAIAKCESDSFQMGELVIPWEAASVTIVSLDAFIMIMFVIAIIRLKWYERVSIEDMKKGKLVIEDFTVVLPQIPISRGEYNNNPDLLTAMLATHLEKTTQHELQQIEELELIQQNYYQVVEINYGLSSQTTMSHLVKIFDECEKIADLKKKIQVDPSRTREYEAQVWKHSTNVTNANDAYYKEKLASEPELKKAYVTFRSMEGMRRARSAYAVNFCQRIAAEYCCCLSNYFVRNKLKQRGFLRVDTTVDPQILIWENLGLPQSYHLKQRILGFLVVFSIMAISFSGQYYLSNIEKDLVDMARSDCSGESQYDIDKAFGDYYASSQQRQGLMNCYCQQMYDKYQEAGLKIVFADGHQYCKDWYYTWVQSRYTSPAIGTWTALINGILTLACTILGSFRKNDSSAANFRATTFAIFISQYVNTAMIILLAHNSFLWSEETRAEYSKANVLVGVFDEFDDQWYLRIGSSIIFAQAAMVFFPHIFTILESMHLCCRRCIDRSCSFNTKKTHKIIQSEYEDLYTGPEFILHVRYAQVLATIFVTLTYSAGIPMLYALNFVILFIQYWVDKWLVFNYYRKTAYFTRHLSKSVVDLLKYAVIIHFLFGFMSYSYPYIWKSSIVTDKIGNDSQYFNSQRLGQVHMFVFQVVFCVVILMFVFETTLVKLWRSFYYKLSFCCGSWVSKLSGQLYDNVDYSAQGFIFSDDLLYEINYGTLYKWYKKAGRDKQRYRQQMQRGAYSEVEQRVYIRPYLETLTRNQREMRGRCMELVEQHEDHLPIESSVYRDREFGALGVEEKINALYELWDAGTNKDNAERDAHSGHISRDMHGRIKNVYQTYDYLDNEKYKRIELLLDIMQETFGFGAEAEEEDDEDTGGEGASGAGHEGAPEAEVEMVDLPAKRANSNDRNAIAPKDVIATRSDLLDFDSSMQNRGTFKSTRGRK